MIGTFLLNAIVPAIPRTAAAYCNRGNALTSLKKFKEALDDFTRAIEIDPRYAMAYYNRGTVRIAIERGTPQSKTSTWP